MNTPLNLFSRTPLAGKSARQALMLTLALALASCAAPTTAPTTPVNPAATAGASSSQAPGTVRGRISFNGIEFGLAQTGRGIAGARVYLESLESLSTETDAEGNFELLGVPDGDHHVVAEATVEGKPMKVRQSIAIAPEQPIADLPSLVLRQTGSMVGVVALAGQRGGTLGADVFVAGTTMVAKAKENGAFTFTNVADGTYNVTASFRGHAPLTQKVVVKAGKVSELNFDLLKAAEGEQVARLVGTVRGANGTPVAGAAVSLRGANGLSALSDAQGKFELVNVTAGEHTLMVFHPSHVLFSEKRTVSFDAQAIDAPEVTVGDIVLTASALPPPSNAGTPAANAGNPAPTGDRGQVGPSQEVATGGPVVPGRVVETIAFSGGQPLTTNVGKMALGDQTYDVRCAQPFKVTEGSGITAISFSVIQAQSGAPAADCVVGVYETDAKGNPKGEALRAVQLPAGQIKRLGLGSPFIPVVFDPPVPVDLEKTYAAVISTEGEVDIILTSETGSGGPLRMSFSELGQTAWLWNRIDQNEGIKEMVGDQTQAVFQVHVAD